jgi:hypothetical protein
MKHSLPVRLQLAGHADCLKVKEDRQVGAGNTHHAMIIFAAIVVAKEVYLAGLSLTPVVMIPDSWMCAWRHAEGEIVQMAALLMGEMLQESLWTAPLHLALAFAVRYLSPPNLPFPFMTSAVSLNEV